MPLGAFDGQFTPPRNFLVDSGLVILSIATFIGHTLMIDAFLRTEVGGFGDLSEADLSDFGSSFSVRTVVLTPGVELVGLQVAAVPEPQTYAILLSGLLMVGGALRRRQRAETASATPGLPMTQSALIPACLITDLYNSKSSVIRVLKSLALEPIRMTPRSRSFSSVAGNRR